MIGDQDTKSITDNSFMGSDDDDYESMISDKDGVGSGAADDITIRGTSAFSAPVTLGDDSNDAIHVVGRATFDAPTVLQSTAELTVHADITLGARKPGRELATNASASNVVNSTVESTDL